MEIEYIPVEKYVRRVSQASKAIVLPIAMGICISLFANDGIVTDMPSLQYDTNRQLVELVDNSHSVSVPLADKGDVCFILNSNEENTADKLMVSFAKLKIDEMEVVAYEETFSKMSTHISSLPFVKTTADIDQSTKSLELMGVLPSGILMTLAKPYTTLADNNALLTIVYQREVIMSALVDLSDVASKMLSVESKLRG